MEPDRQVAGAPSTPREVEWGPVGVEELAALAVEALVGVRTEVVALGLQQVGGQALAAVAVVEGQGGR